MGWSGGRSPKGRSGKRTAISFRKESRTPSTVMGDGDEHPAGLEVVPETRPDGIAEVDGLQPGGVEDRDLRRVEGEGLEVDVSSDRYFTFSSRAAPRGAGDVVRVVAPVAVALLPAVLGPPDEVPAAPDHLAEERRRAGSRLRSVRLSGVAGRGQRRHALAPLIRFGFAAGGIPQGASSSAAPRTAAEGRAARAAAIRSGRIPLEGAMREL